MAYRMGKGSGSAAGGKSVKSAGKKMPMMGTKKSPPSLTKRAK